MEPSPGKELAAEFHKHFRLGGRREAPQSDRLVSGVARMLERANYQRRRLDDDISERLHRGLIRQLDPMKLYFLQSDIEAIEKYALQHDDLLKKDDLSAATEVVSRHQERLEERVGWAIELSRSEFDFDKPEVRLVLPDACEFATSERDAKQRWRTEVKFKICQLLASDVPEDQARTRVRQEYEWLIERSKRNPRDAAALYLHALARSMDPHSGYFPPKKAARAASGLTQSLVGIGVLVEMNDGALVVRAAIPGGPAAEDDRLNAGDRILSVGQGKDGELIRVTGAPLNEIVDLVRGEAGSLVRLEVRSVGGPVRVVDLVRRRGRSSWSDMASRRALQRAECDPRRCDWRSHVLPIRRWRRKAGSE